jgi:quaternary ammonium compound-resistance protein SugE
MTGAWTWLVLAGLVEVAFTQSIRPTEHFTRPGPTLLCLVLGATSVYLLTHAMSTLPVGTAYVVFTGLGSVGAVALGIAIGDEPISPVRLLGLCLVVAGICVSHAAAGTS